MKAKNKQASGQNRMFKYLLTDGRTQIIGLEIQPLYSINLERTLPGSKLLLMGPIEVRRGIWLLKQTNIRLLWENTDKPKMVPKMGFSEANQSILKPKAQLMLMQKAKEGFKQAQEDSEMRDEQDGEGNETTDQTQARTQQAQVNYNEHFDKFEKKVSGM